MQGRWTKHLDGVSNNDNWYIVPHDEMLGWNELAAAQRTASWLKENACYQSATQSKTYWKDCGHNRASCVDE